MWTAWVYSTWWPLYGDPKMCECQYIRYKMCPWSTNPVITLTGIFVAITNNTWYGSKIIRILSKDHVPWRHFVNFLLYNISKLNFWFVICIAKNLIWTTLKEIFSMLRFFCSLRFSYSCISAKYCPIINHTSMEIWIIQFQFSISKNDCFYGPGSQIYRKSLAGKKDAQTHLRKK